LAKVKNITLLLPTKDHEESILNNFAQLKKFCTENIKSFEILIISNGSSSHSLNLIEDIKHHSFVNHMILDKPGKGAAVKQGLINSEFKNIVIFDADFSYNIDNLKKFFDEKGHPKSSFMYVSRKLSRELFSNVSLLRLVAGRVYNFLVKKILKIDSNDTQAGFKFIDKSIFTNCANFTSDNFDFDIELFLLAKKIGIKPIPIFTKDVVVGKHSNIGVFKDSVEMLINLFKIRKMYL